MEKEMEKVLNILIMEKDMNVNFLMVKNMEKENYIKKILLYMKENI